MLDRFKFRGRGVADVLRSSETRAELTRRAEAVLRQAEGTAPRESGRYAGSLRIVQATTDRAVVRVQSDLPYALAVQARTGNLPRALDAAGGS